MKGEATVEFIEGKPTTVKGEIQTKMKVRNTSKGSIALLSVEEIWYNTKREIASNGDLPPQEAAQPRRDHRVHDQLAGQAGPR